MRTLLKHRLWIGAVAAALLLSPLPAAAADTDPANVSAARALAAEGLALYDKQQYGAALDKLQRAHDLVHAPTTGLYTARCMERLGRLLDASELFLEVSRMQLAPDAKQVFKDAVVDAGKEYEALKARIPKLAISIRGAPASEVTVTLDGKPVPPALIGVNRPTDPGTRAVEGKWGDRVVKRSVVLKEGATEEMILDFAGPTAGSDAGGTLRTLGWVGVGVGAAGVALGGIMYGVGASLQGDLVAAGCSKDLDCPDTPAIRDKLSTYNAVNDVPVPAFIAGGVLVAGGVVLILTAPSSRPKAASVALRPWVSPWGAGFTGVF